MQKVILSSLLISSFVFLSSDVSIAINEKTVLQRGEDSGNSLSPFMDLIMCFFKKNT